MVTEVPLSQDLVEASITLTRGLQREKLAARVAQAVEDRIILELIGPNSSSDAAFRELLRSGALDDRKVTHRSVGHRSVGHRSADLSGAAPLRGPRRPQGGPATSPGSARAMRSCPHVWSVLPT